MKRGKYMKVSIELVGNSTITINVDNVIKFGMDPALDVKGSSLGFGIYRKKNPVYNERTFQDLDFWLLTHAHADHIDVKGVNVIDKKLPIISAPSCKKTLEKFGVQNKVEYVNWNEVTLFEKENYQMIVKAIPAYHGYGSLVVKLMTRVNGYVITIKKGDEDKTIYITSDTVYNSKVVSALQDVHADILIANLGEAKAPLPVTRKPITMDLVSLQKFAHLTRAKHIIPLHIDDYSHFKTKCSDVEKLYPIIAAGEIAQFEI